MHGEMSDTQYRVLMPGPWPGPPQPFHAMTVFRQSRGPSCGACPKSMYCLAGKPIRFGPAILLDCISPFTVCRRCGAVVWHQDDIIYLCYRLAVGVFARCCNPEKIDFLYTKGSVNHRLAYALAATIGSPDPDLAQRYFPRDDTCFRINQLGDCEKLYATFIEEQAHSPLHDRALNPFIENI